VDLVTFLNAVDLDPLEPGGDALASIRFPTRAFGSFYRGLLGGRTGRPADVLRAVTLDFATRAAPFRAAIAVLGRHRPPAASAVLYATAYDGELPAPGAAALYSGYAGFRRWVTVHGLPYDPDQGFQRLSTEWGRVLNPEIPFYCSVYSGEPSLSEVQASLDRMTEVSGPPELVALELASGAANDGLPGSIVAETDLSLVPGWGDTTLLWLSTR